jgi:hypothetical protein
MKKNLGALLVVVTVVALLASCASMQWVSRPRPPVIGQLSNARSLGVAVYATRLKLSEHLLVKVGKGDYWAPTDVGAFANKVALRYTSPDAISKFAVNGDNLGALCRKAWVDEMGSADFDLSVLQGLMKPARVMSKSLSGEQVTGGYDSVVEISDALSRRAINAQTITSLGEQYKVDAILIIEPQVYGEVGKVVPEDAKNSSGGKKVKPGNFVLWGTVDYEYELYDAKSGAKITDSSATKSEFPSMISFHAGNDVAADLNVTKEPALDAYLNGPKFLDLYVAPAKAAVIPWVTLFKPHYLASFEEVKK